MIIIRAFGMVIRIGINGFGRIGRVIFRKCFQDKDLEISAINDPAIDIEYICYLIKFDSTHGKFKKDVTYSANEITIDDVKVKVFSEKLPSSIPWHTAAVQYVVEASGMFTSLEKASGHLESVSVKRVIVTAPTVDVPMMILGVNEGQITAEHNVISCSSSTLYCLAPIMKILQDNYGVTDGFITSIHAMTPSLKPLDGLCLRGKHWRDHRSIHQNIIPAATGACKALGEIIPQVKNKMMGLAFRVPIVNVSVLDITVRLNKTTTIQDIIKCVEAKSRNGMKNIIKISKDQEVSSDFLGDENSCILDINSSLQLNPNFFKLICWYENEYSYACRVADSIKYSETNHFKLMSKISLGRLAALKQPVYEKPIPYFNKEYCTYNISSKPKLLLASSQESTLKCTHRPRLCRRPLSLQDSGCNQFTKEPSTTCRNISRNRNDDIQISKPLMKENRRSFFQSCIALPWHPSPIQRQNYVKTQEHLEEVKKEISKMVDMTEKLLKQSSPIHCEINVLEPNTMEQNGDKNDTSDKYVHSKNLRNSNHDVMITRDGNSSTKENNNDQLRVCRKENAASYIAKPKIELNQFIQAQRIDAFNTRLEPKSNAEDHIIYERNDKTLLEQKQNAIVIQDDQSHKDEKVYPNLAIKSNIALDKIGINNSNEISTDSNSLNYGNSHNINEFQNTYTLNIDKLNKENFEINLIKDKIDADKDGSIAMFTRDIVEFTEDNKSIVNHVDETSVRSIMDLKTAKVEKNKIISKKEIQKKIIEGIIKKLSNHTTEEFIVSPCVESHTTFSNGESFKNMDIYDKLDSASATDSENSFEINEKKSQIIDITDLTSSVEDLSRLDKICRIIEISDELSDKLFSALKENDGNIKNNKWSFKDLCERIKLDEFCNNIFGLQTNKTLP